MVNLAYLTLEEPTGIGSVLVGHFTTASSLQIAITRQSSLEIWEPKDDVVVPCASYALGQHVEAIVRVPCEGGKLLDAVLALTIDCACWLLEYVDGRFQISASVDLKPLPSASSVPEVQRLDGIRVSEAFLADTGSGSAWVVTASIFHHYLNVITVRWGTHNLLSSLCVSAHRTLLLDPRIVARGREDLALIRDVSHVLALCFMPQQRNEQGEHLLAILHHIEGPSQSSVNLDCVALDLHKGVIRSGPWSCRNLHPTTQLLHAVPGIPGRTPPGVLAISSCSILLITAPSREPSAPLTWKEGQMRQLVSYTLGGVPTCVAPLGSSQLIIGDSAAGLHLVSLDGSPWIVPVQPAGRLSVPAVLAHVPAAAPGGSGFVVLGSRCGSSQVLSVPDGTTLQTACPTAPLRWPVPQPALLPSLAPVLAAATFHDTTWGDEQQLVVACGLAPRGRLCRVHMAACLQAFTSDGPELPGSVSMFALRGSLSEEHHSLLAFSMDALDRTEVMRIHGSTISPTSLPGLDAGRSSLLLATLPGWALLQATSAELRVLRQEDGSLLSTWRPPAALQTAASLGSCVVASTVDELHCLEAAADGQLTAAAPTKLQYQVSALAVFNLSAQAERADVCIAVGEWVANRVRLLSWQGLACLCSLDLLEEQPRSMAYLHLGGRPTLLAGTSTGRVLLWQLATAPGGGIQAGEQRSVSISNCGVHLQVVPASPTEPAYVYAHSGCDTIIRSCHQEASTSGQEGTQEGAQGGPVTPCDVQVLRVHGGRGSRAMCPLHTAALPHGLAWVTASGRLALGALDTRGKLRWATAHIGDTTEHMAMLQHCNALVLLSTDGEGNCWLRLVDAASLQQLLAYKLQDGHQYSALLVAPLPCSSMQPTSQSHSSLPSSNVSRGTSQAIPSGSTPRDASQGMQQGVSSSLVQSPSQAPPQGTVGTLQRGGSLASAQAASAESGKQFVVVATHLPLPDGEAGDARGEGPARRLQGLLSFFEVEYTPGPQPQYRLLLHATHLIPSVAFSLAVGAPVWDSLVPLAGEEAGEQLCAEAGMPMVVAGCTDGVHVYKVFLDDSGQAGRAAVGAALEQVTAQPLWQRAVGGGGGQEAGEAAGPGPSSLDGGLEDAGNSLVGAVPEGQDWRRGSRLEPLAQCAVAGGGAVMSLAVHGSTICAVEFMSSVTAMKLLVNRNGVALMPLGVDHSGTLVQAACALDDSSFLLAGAAGTALLVQRDEDAEQSRLQQAHQYVVHQHERAARRPQAPGSGPHLGPWRSDAAVLEELGAAGAAALLLAQVCRPGHSVTTLLPAQLGLHLQTPGSAAPPGVVLSLSPSGAVGAFASLSNETAAMLMACQAALEAIDTTAASEEAATYLPMGLRATGHHALWRKHVPWPDWDAGDVPVWNDSTVACVDLAYLQAFLRCGCEALEAMLRRSHEANPRSPPVPRVAGAAQAVHRLSWELA